MSINQRMSHFQVPALALVTALALFTPGPANAQAPAPFAVSAADATAAANTVFTTEELKKLLAPYALYPDDLLAQLLPACAYPVDIVQVSRWLMKNEAAVAAGNFSGLDAQPWDASVKALARFPDLIAKLNDDLDATTDIGDAFVYQPDDVAAVIQAFRQEAQKTGSLKTTPQQTVKVESQGGTNYITIEPTEPGVIYVPTYDPATVYYNNGVAAGLIGFTAGVVVGIAVDNVWDWGRGWVYPPRWPGYPGYRPGSVNIGNDVDINVGNNVSNGNRPWRPDADRYRPGQGSKPGLNRPNAGNRPQGGNGIGTIGAGAGRPDLDPGGPSRPGGPSGERGPGDIGGSGGVGGPGQRLDIARPDAPRPNVDRPAQRPAAAPDRPRPEASRPNASRPKPQQRPAQARPSRPPPARDTAFSGARGGGQGMAQRGGASRQSVPRPSAARGGGGRGGGRGGRH